MTVDAAHLDQDVVVVGAGPVGLWLAGELRLGGARVAVLEKRLERTSYSRALTLHARTLEVFAMRGIVEAWLAEGVQIPTTHYAMLSSRLDLTGLDTDYPFALFMPQLRTEELLEQRVHSLGADVRRGVEVGEVAADLDGVTVRCTDGQELRAQYVVGCDGRRSIVREAAGISYTGTEDWVTSTVGDVVLTMTDPPAALTMHTETGSFYLVRIDARRHRLIGIEHVTDAPALRAPVDLEGFRELIVRITGSDFSMTEPSWLSTAGSATFQADRYREGRLLLAGDSAHVHFPMGGQGLNLGVQDAMNLGWKLARTVTGRADPSVLDSYGAERQPIGQLVIDDTLAQTGVVGLGGREGQAVREMMTAALGSNPELNKQFAIAVSGMGVRYPGAPGDHPLVGTRAPNVRLDDGSTLYEQLVDACFVLVGPAAKAASHSYRDARVVQAGFVGRSDWAGTGAVLIRPDGHVAWACTSDSEESR
jgi:2-polyprenyl-6-methoxyphenol hydroxylase-like FAD-dependent oxidoreductase